MKANVANILVPKRFQTSSWEKLCFYFAETVLSKILTAVYCLVFYAAYVIFRRFHLLIPCNCLYTRAVMSGISSNKVSELDI